MKHFFLVVEDDEQYSEARIATIQSTYFSVAKGDEHKPLIVRHFQRRIDFLSYVGCRSLSFALPYAIKFVTFGDFKESIFLFQIMSIEEIIRSNK